jgi:hypothetical protein
MKRSTQTALELIRLAAILRKQADEIIQIQQRDEMRAAAGKLEVAAHTMIKEERAKMAKGSESDLYAAIHLTI